MGFLAVDFPGHGYSSKLAPGMFYQYTIYQLTISSIAKYFNWPKISLMGHSLGGVMSYVYAMVYPQDVDFLICLDGAKPMVDNNKVEMLGRRLLHFPKYDMHAASPNEPPSYSMEDIIAKISKPNKNSILPEYAKYIIERNIAPSKLHEGKHNKTYFIKLIKSKINCMN